MPLTLHWTISSPERVCRTFTCLKVYRADSLSGRYVEISTPSSRPTLSAAVSRYAFSDPSGSTAKAYASSYFNPQTHAESSLSKPQYGRSDPALSLLSVADLREKYLFGLKLTDTLGRPLPDSVFETGIRTALSWVERRLGISLVPCTVEDEQHDFRPDLQRHYALLHVNRLPLQSVQTLSLRLPGQASASATVTTADLRWQQWEGSVQVAAGSRFGGLSGSSALYGSSYAASLGFCGNLDYLPGALRVSYTAGFADGELPADILDLLAKAASLQPLAVAGDLVAKPGLSSTSISIDSMSQSVGRTGTPYSERMNAYQQQLQTDLKAIKSSLLGVRIRVL